MDTEELESDWIHSVFEVFREEVVAIAADFGDRVKGELDQVAASQDVRPPSAMALFTSVAIESTNVAVSLLPRRPADGDSDSDSDSDGESDADLGSGSGADAAEPDDELRSAPPPGDGDKEND